MATPFALKKLTPDALGQNSESQLQRMKIIEEFKTFISRGNAIELAVGVIIGAAFGKIVTSIVEDLMMPVIGIFAKANFSNLYLPLFPPDRLASGTSLADARAMGPVLAYGNFLTALVNFLIVAWCVFLLVKAMNKFVLRVASKATETPAKIDEDVRLLTEIRDLLAHRKD